MCTFNANISSVFQGNSGWILGLQKVKSLIYGAVNPPVTRTQAVKEVLEWLHCLSYTST